MKRERGRERNMERKKGKEKEKQIENEKVFLCFLKKINFIFKRESEKNLEKYKADGKKNYRYKRQTVRKRIEKYEREKNIKERERERERQTGLVKEANKRKLRERKKSRN